MAQHLGFSQLDCLEEGNISIEIRVNGSQIAVESFEVLRGQNFAQDGNVLEISCFVGILEPGDMHSTIPATGP